MPDTYKNYLLDLGDEIKDRALEARQQYGLSSEGSEDRAVIWGRLLELYGVVTLMQQMAEGFDIPLSDLKLENIEPDRDLLSSLGSLTSQQQADLTQIWERDLARNQEIIEVLRGLLESKKEVDKHT